MKQNEEEVERLVKESKEHLVYEMLYALGEDPDRNGLRDTPSRVIKSWKEIYSGYGQKPEDVLTIFEEECDEIIILKNIELYSMCEHHNLPFIGKAHIAYIPDKKQVLGISKLARLLDIYARRMQIQERIGIQVTEALMKLLKPKGAACIIEAQHLCMQMRGVGKQNSIMTTSSMRGIFLDETAPRQELMQLIAL